MTSLAKFCGVDESYKYYEQTGYRDIAADSPLAPYVKWARDAGLMDGSNGSFLPDEKLTREQMATVVARYLTALGLASMDTAQTSYKDDARISAWAKAGVALCTQEGILQGSNGSFLPKGKLTRGPDSSDFVPPERAIKTQIPGCGIPCPGNFSRNLTVSLDKLRGFAYCNAAI